MSGAEVQRRPAAEVEPEVPVVDAEIVIDDPPPTSSSRSSPGAALARPRWARLLPVAPPASTPRDVGRTVGRHIWAIGQGACSCVHRIHSAATFGHFHEQIRLARLVGDRTALAEWTDRLQDAKESRTKRVLLAPRAAIACLFIAGLATALSWR